MTTGSSWLRAQSLALGFTALAALASACGGDDGGDDGGNGGGTPSPSPVTCVAGTSVDIGASGASPGCLQVDPGTTVTFANGRTTDIEIRSAPHPNHGSCPELDTTPPIPAGGSIDVTMVTEASCSFHDHLTGTTLGLIQVGPPDPSDPYNPYAR